MGKTRIIAIEGIDGCGKTVQFDLLKSRLESMGFTVATRSFPIYESFFGAQVGKYLSNKEGVSAIDVDNKSMALWFALDRWESFVDYKDDETDFLLINRYVLSNAVYQSIRAGDTDIADWVLELEYEHFRLPHPDVTVVLSVTTSSASENVDKKGFRDYVGGTAKDVYESSGNIQQRAMDMLDKGVKQVANVVQANSATAEESASASQQLSAQAELLQESVKGFRLRS